MGWTTIERTGDTLRQAKIEDGRLVVRTIQENDEVLELNQAARNAGGLGARDWCRMEANIPMQDYMRLKKMYPDLDAPDPQIRKREWVRVLKMPEHRKYSVQTKFRPGVLIK